MSGINQNYKKKNVLKKLYLDKGLSIRKIAEILHVDQQVIHYFLQKFNIPRRPSKGKAKEKFKINKKILEELYVNKKLSTKKIAQMFGVKSHKTILLKLIKYGIPRRSKSEAATYPKQPFSGDLKEKAYLIGLRAGYFSASIHRKLIRLETASG